MLQRSEKAALFGSLRSLQGVNSIQRHRVLALSKKTTQSLPASTLFAHETKFPRWLSHCTFLVCTVVRSKVVL